MTRRDNILAFTWYLEGEYEKLLEVTHNKEGLKETYQQWLVDARRALVKYKKMGFDPRRVYLEVDEYVAWCDRRQRPINAKSREIFKELKRQEFYRRIDRDED